jgi:hypothetical protein
MAADAGAHVHPSRLAAKRGEHLRMTAALVWPLIVMPRALARACCSCNKELVFNAACKAKSG